MVVVDSGSVPIVDPGCRVELAAELPDALCSAATQTRTPPHEGNYRGQRSAEGRVEPYAAFELPEGVGTLRDGKHGS